MGWKVQFTQKCRPWIDDRLHAGFPSFLGRLFLRDSVSCASLPSSLRFTPRSNTF